MCMNHSLSNLLIVNTLPLLIFSLVLRAFLIKYNEKLKVEKGMKNGGTNAALEKKYKKKKKKMTKKRKKIMCI